MPRKSLSESLSDSSAWRVRSEGMGVPSRACISKMHQLAKSLLGGWGTQAQWATLVGYAALTKGSVQYHDAGRSPRHSN